MLKKKRVARPTKCRTVEAQVFTTAWGLTIPWRANRDGCAGFAAFAAASLEISPALPMLSREHRAVRIPRDPTLRDRFHAQSRLSQNASRFAVVMVLALVLLPRTSLGARRTRRDERKPDFDVDKPADYGNR